MEYISIILGAVSVLLLIIICVQSRERRQSENDSRQEILKHIIEGNEGQKRSMYEQDQKQMEQFYCMQQSMTSSLDKVKDTNTEKLAEIEKRMAEMQLRMVTQNQTASERMAEVVQKSLLQIQQSNETKLTEMQTTMNKKLDTSLNERLDSSFNQIGEQLTKLYEKMGELQSLSDGVTNLNKTLSNVKARGTWAEASLNNILEDILTPAQYDKNVSTKKNSSDFVEFAVKIPDKEGKGGFIYLPIDSKFPSDIYNKIVDASNDGDAAALRLAAKELEQRIKTEARTIRDKYVTPPVTTDFAIMFLPTEGLYSEVLRIPGLAEWCQKECKVIISGPTTISALLNSLSIGFKYLTVNKNSRDILKVLSAVKMQYKKFGELITKTSKKLNDAQSATDEMYRRAEMINKKLTKMEEIDASEANDLLGFSTGLIETEEE